MSDKCFFDTNIIIYCYTSTEPEKGSNARALVTNNAHISLQVIQEFANILKKKFGEENDKVLKAIQELQSNFLIHINTIETVKHALNISKRYQYSFYDSLIIAAAIESNSEILYSEDMHHNQVLEEKLVVINPFY